MNIRPARAPVKRPSHIRARVGNPTAPGARLTAVTTTLYWQRRPEREAKESLPIMSPPDEVYFIDADPGASRRSATPPPHKTSRRSLFGRSRPSDATLTGVTAVGGAGASRPAAAATLSLLLCGAGQLYNGRRDVALLYFVTEVLVFSVNWCLWKIWEPLVALLGLFDVRRTDLLVVVAACNWLFLVFVALNALQAFRDAAGLGGADGLGRPLASGLVSLAVPGWGQFLNGQPRKAAVLLGLFLSAAYALALSLTVPGLWRLWDASEQRIFDWTLTNGGLAALAAALVVYLAAFYDALLVARRQRTRIL